MIDLSEAQAQYNDSESVTCDRERAQDVLRDFEKAIRDARTAGQLYAYVNVTPRMNRRVQAMVRRKLHDRDYLCTMRPDRISVVIL